MSDTPIDRSPDLKRLRDEGYNIRLSTSGNHLVVDDVPYVNPAGHVCRGALVLVLSLQADVAAQPDDHTAHFIGDVPSWSDGQPMSSIINSSGAFHLDEGLDAQHYLSAKPLERDLDHYAKVTRYVAAISGPARMIEPFATAQTYALIQDIDPSSPLNFVDTASSRCGISGLNELTRGKRVAIVGLGGTGSYVLDFLAKTHVAEIHLFDGDCFFQHNAFRCPGSPTNDQLQAKPTKVAYLAEMYSPMHRQVIPHDRFVNEDDVIELTAMDAVFVCVDSGVCKQAIVPRLSEAGVTLIDVGMSVTLVDGSLTGLMRTTVGTPGHYDHLGSRISFSDFDGDDYARNIQVVELNALNAALAVIKWKKTLGYYADLRKEHDCTYVLTGNHIENADPA